MPGVKGRSGRKPMDAHVLKARGSRVPKALAYRPAVNRTEVSPSDLSNLESDCRTQIPRYDPWDKADGYRFDVEKASKAIRWIEANVVHVKGHYAGQAFRLLPWERAVVGNLFGWVWPDGYRRYRRAYISVARKNGKTPLMAAVVLYVFFEDGEPGAEVYSTAATRDQAKLVWESARAMILRNPDLDDRCEIYRSSNTIQLLDDPLTAYKPIAAEAKGAHGFNTHCAVNDELHAHTDRELIDVLDTSTIHRRQPLILNITTAGYDRHSICFEHYQRAKNIIGGTSSDASYLPVVFEVPHDVDWKDETRWHEANPSIGHTILLDDLRREYQRAIDIPSYENTFRQLHLNQWTEQAIRWLSMTDWDACGEEFDLAEFNEKPCYGGLDLAIDDDLSAFVLCFPYESLYYLIPHFYVPEDKVGLRGRRDGVDYVAWARRGLVTVTPGQVIDFEYIRRDINRAKDQYRLIEVAFDPWQATYLAVRLTEEDGVFMIQHRQGTRSMSEPSINFASLVKSRRIRHGGNPILRWHAGNAVVRRDPAGNIKPDKEKAVNRIDGIVASIMATGRACHATRQGSYYDSNPLEVL